VIWLLQHLHKRNTSHPVKGCLNGNSFLHEDPNYVASTHILTATGRRVPA
jgi:hypothetical protein